jgi:hypothetical protein
VNAVFEPNGLDQCAGNLPIEEIHEVDAKQHGKRKTRVLLLISHRIPVDHEAVSG